MFVRILLVAIVSLMAHAAAAQSFDCAKATTRIEKMVCADRSIADLDEYLGRYYAAARAGNAPAASCLQADQSEWLKSKRDACADASCLKSAYLDRLAELDPLQPGATALKNLKLPSVPSLAWVIPPAADKVAAPANPKAKPFEATGTIVNDIANGDGIILRTADGKSIPLMLLMFLDSPSQDYLTGFAKEKNVTFRARGYVTTDPSGKQFFEPSRCTFLHRLPAGQAKPAAAAPKPVEADMEQDLERVRKIVITNGKVCPDPGKPCPGFKENELSFAISRPFQFDRGRDKSQPFYAVILQSAALCSIQDAERVKAQKAFPRSKVFLHRYFCEDFGDKVTYTGVNEKSGFVAVYGGETEAEAQAILAQAKAAGYAGANVRRMEVVIVYQLE